MSDNAYINDLEERNAELRRELAEAKKKIAQLEAFDAANKAAIERSWTFTPEHLAKVRNDPVSITDRLRGNYGGRSFPASAICVVAADMLDEAKAQLTAANATIAACKEAGFIDAEGRVRKVLGTLPLTADNCIAGFPPGTGGLWYKMPSGHVMQTDPRRMVYEQSSRCVLTWLAGYGDVLVSACYSTSADAREAQ